MIYVANVLKLFEDVNNMFWKSANILSLNAPTLLLQPSTTYITVFVAQLFTIFIYFKM